MFHARAGARAGLREGPGARPDFPRAVRVPRAVRAALAGLAALLAALAAPPVAAAPPAGTPIDNVAQGAAVDSGSGAALAAGSNRVRAVVQSAVPPALAFYADPAYAAPTRRVEPGRPLYLAAFAPQCDTDPARRDTVRLHLASERAGDTEVYAAVETAPASGVFRVEPFVPTTALAGGFTGQAIGVVELEANDAVTAVLFGCGAPSTEARAWVDPSGAVFDARGGAGVPGARVALVDVTGAGNGGAAGGPARVFLADGVTPAPDVVVTDAAGRFRFPALPASRYRLVVTPPAGWRVPSGVAPGALPATAYPVDPGASYGGDFDVAVDLAPVRWGVPADAVSPAVLVVRKRASRPAAEIGDLVGWTIEVENGGDDPLDPVVVTDALPPGFRYVAGSARRDTARVADPAFDGAAAAFALGRLEPRAKARLAFDTRVGPGAFDGDGVNRAWATADTTRSNEATARVIVTGGVFAEEAMITGTVFLDRDRDRRRGPGEPGVPGVRVWLDDGTWAITDRGGRYSLYGLEPRTHALRLDPLTLPAGAEPLAAGRRDQGTPGLRLADLQRGELHRADFPLAGDSLALRAALERAAAPAFGDELERAAAGGAAGTAAADDGRLPGDPRARPATAVTTAGERLPLFGDAARLEAAPPAPAFVGPPAAEPMRAGEGAGGGAPASGGARAGTADVARPEAAATEPGDADAAGPAAAAARAPLEDLAATFGTGVAFVDLADGDTLLAAQTPVRVRGAFGLGFELVVNGAPVGAGRVGRKAVAMERGVEAWEYVGVDLRPGENLLTVSQRGAGGRAGGSATVRVLAPGGLARLELDAPRSAPADGRSLAAVRVRALDRSGLAVGARTLVTLETTAGQWQARDLDPETPGLQVALEGGGTAIGLLAPSEPGVAHVRASAGALRADRSVAFVPELRPLLAFGVLEGTVSWDDLRRGRAAPARPRTGFETGAEHFRSERRDGAASAAARGALFLKGRVAEDVLLTLGVATDKPEGLRRFRDVQPDAFYPVYGDASARGYEAQSTGRLHARLDRRGSSLLFGDFVTRGAGGARGLAAYDRSLTGARVHWEERRLRLDAFSSRDRSRRRVVELPGRGVSGPYTVPGAPVVENSERVEIVTRDRDQPAVVRSAAPRARFTDYEFDALTGRLLFKGPVPSLDADLHPVWVRVTYEVEQGGEPFWVSGAEARVKLADGLEVGGSYVDDHDPEGARELRGAFLGARLGAHTAFEGEWAETRAARRARGDAGRLELRHDGPRLEGRLFAAATDTAFDNPGAGFGPGRLEAGARWLAKFQDDSRLRLEALFTADAAGAARRGGGLLAVERGLARDLRGELGVRVAGERRAAGGAVPSAVALRARLAAQLPGHPEWSGFAEAEQSLGDERRMAALGGEYRFARRGRLYARHELISSLAGPWTLDGARQRLATVAGVDADLAGEARAFGEYRVGDAVSGREGEAALGLRNAWRLEGGARVGVSFERLTPLRGGGAGATTAMTASVEHAEGDDWKGSSRFEVRTGRAGDAFLHTMAAACRLDSAWTALGRNQLSVSDERAGRGAARERLQLGFAHRQPRREDWDALGRYELRLDREANDPEPRRRRLAHVVSLHATGRLLEAFTASGGWAGKRVAERVDGAGTRSGAQWVHGRLTWAFGRDWDAGVHGSLLFLDGAVARRHGLGLEAGRQLGGGVWLSAGWNRFGYEDDDFSESEWTREGAYLRIRARFDESLLGRPGGAR